MFYNIKTVSKKILFLFVVSKKTPIFASLLITNLTTTLHF